MYPPGTHVNTLHAQGTASTRALAARTLPLSPRPVTSRVTKGPSQGEGHMACRNAPAATLESKPSHCPGLLVQLTRPLARAEAPVIRTRTCQPLPIRAEFHGGHGFRVASQGEFQSVVWFNRGRLLKRQHQSPKALCWFQAQTHLLSSKSTFQVPSRPSGSHLSNWTGFNLGYFPPQPCFSCRPLLRAPAAPGQLNTEASQGPTPPPMQPEAPCDVAATPRLVSTT